MNKVRANIASDFCLRRHEMVPRASHRLKYGVLLLAAVWLRAARAELYDAAVVGLGPAGMAALTRLTELGYKAIGLEAKDRIGGRVNTQEFGGGLVEFGAEWIHGEKGNPTYQLARQNNVPIINTQWQIHCANNAGYNQTMVLDLYNHCMDEYEKAQGPNITLGEYMTTVFNEYVSNKPGIAENKDFRDNFLQLLERALSSLDAYDSWHDESVRGAQDYVECEGSQGWSWHTLGYRTLFDVLLHKYNNGTALPVDVRLGSAVSEVEWARADRVALTAGGQVFEAKVAIITVSLGVLKHEHSTLFKPTLPEDKVRAIEALSMGVVDKICLYYEERWWGDNNAVFFLWTDAERNALPAEDWWLTQISSYSTPMSNDHVLTLWITGAGARHMETLPLQVVREKTKSLLQIFYKDVPDAKDIHRSAWYSDAHVRGSYSFHGRATDALPDAAAELAAAVPRDAPRLLFAGEASHPHHFSTVHGAIETGWREADAYHLLYKSENTQSKNETKQ